MNDYRRRYKQLLDDGSAESARMLRELEDKEMALSDRSRRVAELEGMLRSREEAIDEQGDRRADRLRGQGTFHFDPERKRVRVYG